MNTHSTQRTAASEANLVIAEMSRLRNDEELADDVMPCGCCSGSCYCDDEGPTGVAAFYSMRQA